ncbi:MAG: rod shape-determining protein MreD [Candidatus Margulisiibacteriota bacterium]|jgi:rod shape-determining protein MreD
MELISKTGNSRPLIMGLVLFLVQSLPIWDWFRQLGINPNFLVVYFILLSFYGGAYQGLKWGLLFGLLIDISSGVYIINTIVMPVLGFLVGSLKNDIFRSDKLLLVLITVLGTLLWMLVYHFVAISMFNQLFFVDFGRLGLLILLNCLAAPVLKLIGAPDVDR